MDISKQPLGSQITREFDGLDKISAEMFSCALLRLNESTPDVASQSCVNATERASDYTPNRCSSPERYS